MFKRPTPQRKIESMIRMWKNKISQPEIGRRLGLSANCVYRHILKYRAANGDERVQQIIAKQKIDRAKKKKLKRQKQKEVCGQTIQEVLPYLCPQCKNVVIFSPCLICLVREKKEQGELRTFHRKNIVDLDYDFSGLEDPNGMEQRRVEVFEKSRMI